VPPLDIIGNPLAKKMPECYRLHNVFGHLNEEDMNEMYGHAVRMTGGKWFLDILVEKLKKELSREANGAMGCILSGCEPDEIPGIFLRFYEKNIAARLEEFYTMDKKECTKLAPSTKDEEFVHDPKRFFEEFHDGFFQEYLGSQRYLRIVARKHPELAQHIALYDEFEAYKADHPEKKSFGDIYDALIKTRGAAAATVASA